MGAETRNGTVTVVGLGGSLAHSSTSIAALRVAMEAAASRGADTQTFDIKELDLPLYKRGIPVPDAAENLLNAVVDADAMLWSSPVYHGSISGAFKNAVDWFDLLGERQPPYLAGRVVGLISAAGGVQGLQAINAMEFIVRALRGWVAPLVVPISRASSIFDADGRTDNTAVLQQLRILGEEVVRVAELFRSPASTSEATHSLGPGTRICGLTTHGADTNPRRGAGWGSV